MTSVKRGMWVMLGVLLIVVSAGCGASRIGPGMVGIEVKLAGGARGIQDIPLRTGWVFYNPLSTEILEYPTFVQTALWTHANQEGNEELSFNSKEGMNFTADVNLSYSLAADKVPHFYVKYKADNLDRFTHGFLRQLARDEFNNVGATYAAEDIYGPKKEQFVKEVRERVNVKLDSVGLSIDSLGFIGAPRAPEQFVNAINMKLAATQIAQQRENELRAAEAEAKKRIAAAEGEAESNKRLTLSLSPALLDWRRLEITEQSVKKWNGQVPMIQGQSGAGLLINIPSPTGK